MSVRGQDLDDIGLAAMLFVVEAVTIGAGGQELTLEEPAVRKRKGNHLNLAENGLLER